jgi:hypothetical protein
MAVATSVGLHRRRQARVAGNAVLFFKARKGLRSAAGVRDDALDIFFPGEEACGLAHRDGSSPRRRDRGGRRGRRRLLGRGEAAAAVASVFHASRSRHRQEVREAARVSRGADYAPYVERRRRFAVFGRGRTGKRGLLGWCLRPRATGCGRAWCAGRPRRGPSRPDETPSRRPRCHGARFRADANGGASQGGRNVAGQLEAAASRWEGSISPPHVGRGFPSAHAGEHPVERNSKGV